MTDTKRQTVGAGLTPTSSSYSTDHNDSDAIDRQYSTMLFTRSCKAEIMRAYDAVRSNIDWLIVSEPHALASGSWQFSTKPDPNFDAANVAMAIAVAEETH